MSSASIASMNNDRPFNTTSFPSSLPTPISPPSPSSTSPPSLPPPRARNLRLLLRGSFAHSDKSLARLTNILAAPSGQDTVLATVGYTLHLVHASVNGLLAHQLKSIATQIAKNANNVLLPGETVIASLPAPKIASLLAQTSASSKALADLISDYRIFVRLWGLLGIYAWAKETWASPPRDVLLKRIAWVQVGVNAAYQVLENVAYLAQHGVLRRDERKMVRDWCWSSRFWAAHVALEFVRLWRVRVLWDMRESDGEEEEKEEKAKRRKEMEAWWRSVFVNICYAPMTIHWSFEEGVFSEAAIGLCGAMAGAMGLRQMWRQTA